MCWIVLVAVQQSQKKYSYFVCLTIGAYLVLRKRYTLHLTSSCKVITFGAVSVQLVSLLKSGLSVKAYVHANPMSDKQAAYRLNPGFFGGSWQDPGPVICAVVLCLLLSGWQACRGFSREEQFLNVMSAYYLVLLGFSTARTKHGSNSSKHFWHITTVRNLLSLAGHAVLAHIYWDREVPWMPRCREERICEHMYGEAKKPFRGSPSFKDALYGFQAHHARLHQKGVPTPQGESVEALGVDRASVLAERALGAACRFFCSVSTNLRPKEAAAELRLGSTDLGQTALFSRRCLSRLGQVTPKRHNSWVFAHRRKPPQNERFGCMLRAFHHIHHLPYQI